MRDMFKMYRDFWDYCFENPDKIKPNDIAIFSFAVEHCNRLGWKDKFGLPSTMVMEATGISSYNTYIKSLNKLIEIGFIKLITKSKNQYSSNIIAISNFDKAHSKALDKALLKHIPKQPQKQGESNDSIIIPIYNLTNIQDYNKDSIYRMFEKSKNKYLQITVFDAWRLFKMGYSQFEIDTILDKIENYDKKDRYSSLFLTAKNWLQTEHGERDTTKTPKDFEQRSDYLQYCVKNNLTPEPV